MKIKICTTCIQRKEEKEFGKVSGRKGESRHGPVCKECCAKYKKVWSLQNKDRIASYRKNRREKKKGALS